MPQHPVYAVVAFPDPSLGAQLVSASQHVLDGVNSLVVLGESALPHVTIVQWKGAEEGQLVELFRSSLIGSSGVLTLAGLCLVPDPEGSVWFEIPVLSSGWLRELQSGAVAASPEGWEVINGIGDSYRPHVTIGLVDELREPLPLTSLDASVLRQRGSWRVGLARCGEHFTVSSEIRAV